MNLIKKKNCSLPTLPKAIACTLYYVPNILHASGDRA
jgi:hypothetical protein